MKIDFRKEMQEFLGEENYIFDYLHDSYYHDDADQSRKRNHKKAKQKIDRKLNNATY